MAAAGVTYALGIRLGLVHSYYGPAVYAMAHSWEAFVWGAVDPSASITLDKLPLAFQVQALSVRLLGWSQPAVLVPQVIEAVATIGLLFLTVRRWAGPYAGLLASAAYATTPIVAALAHAQIVDTMLVLVLVAAAYAWTRAMSSGRLGWLLGCAVIVSVAFQVKMVQAWGVLPALGLAYLLLAPGTWRRRIVRTALAGAVAVSASLLPLVIAQLVPASSRPWFDGSHDNSVFSMVFGYNLSARYAEGAGQAPGREGGWLYLLGPDVATQAGWLYPAALIGLVGALWWLRRRPRTDLLRAGFVMWGLWLATHAVAFSLGRVAHSFYVVAIAPAVVALAAGGAVLAWRARAGSWWVLPATVAATVAWAVWLSLQYPTFMPWLIPLVLGLGSTSVALLVGLRFVRSSHLAALALGLGVAATLVAPATWAASTTQQGWSGSAIGPAAGPVASMGGGRGQAPGSDGRTRPGAMPSGQPGPAPTGAPVPPAPGQTPPIGQGTAPGASGQTAPGRTTPGRRTTWPRSGPARPGRTCTPAPPCCPSAASAARSPTSPWRSCRRWSSPASCATWCSAAVGAVEAARVARSPSSRRGCSRAAPRSPTPPRRRCTGAGERLEDCQWGSVASAYASTSC